MRSRPDSARRRAVLVDARVEEAHWLAERVQVEADGEAGDATRERDVLGATVDGRDRADPVRLQAPQEHREVRQVRSQRAGDRRAEVGHAREWVERCVEQRERRRVAERRGTATHHRVPVDRRRGIRRGAARVGPLVVEVLRPRKVLEQLGGVDAPAGERLGDRLDRTERALAPPPADRAGDVAPDRRRIAR